jgi:hypothetical protein
VWGEENAEGNGLEEAKGGRGEQKPRTGSRGEAEPKRSTTKTGANPKNRLVASGSIKIENNAINYRGHFFFGAEGQPNEMNFLFFRRGR